MLDYNRDLVWKKNNNYLKEAKIDISTYLISNSINFVNDDFTWDGESIYADGFEWYVEDCELVIDSDILSLTDEDGYEIAIFDDGSIEIRKPEDEIEFGHDEEIDLTELEILRLENAELLKENSELLYRVEILEEMHNSLVNLINKRRVSNR